LEGIAFPDVVRIEVSGTCNFKCRHCKTKNARGLMSYAEFYQILNRLPAAPRVLVLYHSGEPFLNSELEYMLGQAKARGVQKTVLNTNGSLARRLIYLDEMRVSFDGDTAKENDYIRVGSNFERDAARIKELAEQGQHIIIYNTQATGGEQPKTPAYLRDYFGDLVGYRTDPMRVWADSNKVPKGYRVVSKPQQPTTCQALFETFNILANGDVVQCCEDLNGDQIYGNVNQSRPIDIWQSMTKLRQDFAEMHYPEMCQSCWVVAGRWLERDN
jgi:radical SAM protein with 4Fe4S-binding SPASM domain